MHFLHYDSGKLTLTKNIREGAVDYAILSHTWGDEDDEVSFADVTQASLDKAKSRVGFQKVQFCVDRAEKAGLKYSWVDTCCINKADAAEVNESINSMFRWYKNAKQCYVYLSDVSLSSRESGQPVRVWENAFRQSRWFKRGWTLQELLAPSCVLFYSQEGVYLGDRQSLLQLIHEIAAIPESALANFVPTAYNAEQLFSWTVARNAKRAEDMAYCLLGLFDVSMPLVYGEGIEKAIRRLRREIDERDFGPQDKQCVRDLFQTDPRDDKTRIERTKGGLLQDASRWILENNTFQQWHNEPQASFLWIRGDPGKGKTMLLCGIIDELEHKYYGACLSYFFCQESDKRLSNATAVLRGLVYMLLRQRPGLIVHMRDKYGTQGKGLFEDTNAWEAMSKILTDMLRDKQAANAVLLIDALDECTVDLPNLLDLVSRPTGAKWIVSSRNWPSISSTLAGSEHSVQLSLELNQDAISSAVDTYIRCKVNDLALKHQYNQDTSHSIQQHLADNADGTFLWVALVCQVLADTRRWKALTVVRSFPKGLTSLYRRMIESIQASEDAEICQNVLAVASTVYRPVTLSELRVLCESMEGRDAADAEDIVRLCGSFLTLRGEVVYFVHQSAKEHLVNNEAGVVFPSGIPGQHAAIALRSLVALHALRRNIYDLDDVGQITDIAPPACDPLAPIHYACVFWVDHLQEADSAAAEVALEDGGAVHDFLRQKYLYWLEALSLLKSMPGGVIAIRKLESTARTKGPEVSGLIHDAWRFVLSFKYAIEIAPLQAYVSALFFCPRRSKVRELFKTEEPDWLKVMSTDMLDVDWGARVETLEGHTKVVSGVCFSPDGKQIASASYDGTVRLWDIASGKCVRSLACGIPLLLCVAFSPNGDRIAAGSFIGIVKLWNTSGECIWTAQSDHDIMGVAFSPDGKLLAWATGRSRFVVWDVALGQCKWYLQTNCQFASIIFSADGREMACGVRGDTLIVCKIASGQLYERGVQDGTLSMAKLLLGEPQAASPECLLESWHLASGQSGGTFDYGHSCVISPDGRRITFRDRESPSTEIRDVASGVCTQRLYGDGALRVAIAFSPDSQRLVTGFMDGTINVWNVKVKAAIEEGSQKAAEHANKISDIAFSPDGQILVSTSISSSTCRVWDVASGQCKFTLRGHQCELPSMAFSADSRLLASASPGLCKVWDVASAECKHTVQSLNSAITAVALSPSGQLLALGYSDGSCIIQDLASRQNMHLPTEHVVNKVTFSPNGSLLALATVREHNTCVIWDVARRQVRFKIGLKTFAETIAFSPGGRTLAIRNGKRVGTLDENSRIEIWDVESGQCIKEVEDSANFLLMWRDQSPLDLTRPWNYAPSEDGCWLTMNGQQIVWIPTVFRGRFTRCGQLVAFRDARRDQLLVLDVTWHVKK